MAKSDEETVLVEHLDKDDVQRKITRIGGSYHVSIPRRFAKFFNTALISVEFRKENGKRVIVIEEIREVKDDER